MHHAAAHNTPTGVLTWHDMRICKASLQSSKILVAFCLICRAGALMTKAYLKSSNMRQDNACSLCACQGLPIVPFIWIPVREKAPAMPPASSGCRGSRVGIFPSLCSTPSIQDVQSSQSSTMPALEICICALHFPNLERAQIAAIGAETAPVICFTLVLGLSRRCAARRGTIAGRV